MDNKEIRQILKFVDEYDLSTFQLETKDFKVKIQRGGEAQFTAYPAAMPAPAAAPAPAAPLAPTADSAAETPAAASSSAKEITSPMVGTFYLASSPGADPFVSVGDTIKEGQVICIVEAMKVMNEIKSTQSGKVVEIAVEDGTPVQFGETLFRVEPA